MKNRDYLQTFDSLLYVNGSDFWEEEICHVLDGKREIQIKFQGGISEYFKDLIKKTPDPNYQTYLFTKGLINNLGNLNLEEIIHNIDESSNQSIFLSYIDISRTFCSKNINVINYFLDFIDRLYKKKSKIIIERVIVGMNV
jgi:hypothetical protein